MTSEMIQCSLKRQCNSKMTLKLFHQIVKNYIDRLNAWNETMSKLLPMNKVAIQNFHM